MTRLSTAGPIAAAVLSLAALAGCGSSGADAPAAAPSSSSSASSQSSASSLPSATSSKTSMPSRPAARAVITIKGFVFSGPASVSPGATVTVVNQDSEKHTVTAAGSRAFDVGVDGRGGRATLVAPSKPGRYRYTCTLHADMTGVLVVA